MEEQIIAVLVLSQVLYKLWPMPPDSLDSLEYIDLSVLDNLLDASVCRAIDTASADAVGRYDDDRTVIAALAPSLDHIHQLHQRVRGRRHLVSLWPAHELEQLTCFGGRLNSGHELGEGNDLLVDLEDPALDVGVVVVRHVLHGKHLTVLLRLSLLRPERRVCITNSWRRVAQHDDGGAVVVVDEGPDVAAGARHGPLCHDVLSGVGVAVHKDGVDVVRAVVALEGGDVRPEVVRWHNEDISVFVPVVRPVSCRAVANCEPWRLVADQRVLLSIFVLFGLFVFIGFVFNLIRELRHGKSRVYPASVLQKGLVHKTVLVQRLDQSSPEPPHLLEVAVHVKDSVLLAQLDVGVNGDVHTRSTSSVVAVYNDGSVLRLRLVIHHLPHSSPELQKGVAERI